MSNKYKTRNHGRHSTPGQFVPANSAGEGSLLTANPDQLRRPNPAEATQAYKPEELKEENPTQHHLQDNDQEMKVEVNVSTNNEESRPPWMKSRLGGVKKVTNKERRRRQNETLRRLLTPKNALMVLNEMLPKDQLASNFKVETVSSPGPFVKPPSYRANLTLEGNNYKGFGENKLSARNAAAEQAIRDLILKKMSKAIAGEVSSISEECEEEPLPMIQLASFALHKLFCEWEVEGHKVPQFKSLMSAQGSEPEQSQAAQTAQTAQAVQAAQAAQTAKAAQTAQTAQTAQSARAARGSKKAKALPAEAGAMHPCMLLTYMRPALEYRELAAQGDRPQNMLYTFAIDVDGATYVGTASNKKEARRAAAQAACKAIFGVEFASAVSYST